MSEYKQSLAYKEGKVIGEELKINHHTLIPNCTYITLEKKKDWLQGIINGIGEIKVDNKLDEVKIPEDEVKEKIQRIYILNDITIYDVNKHIIKQKISVKELKELIKIHGLYDIVPVHIAYTDKKHIDIYNQISDIKVEGFEFTVEGEFVRLSTVKGL